MNIIILDDMEERHDGFKRILEGHNLFHAWSYTQFIQELDVAYMRSNKVYDMACLDHDLGDNPDIKHDRTIITEGMRIGATRQRDGRDIARWLVANWRLCPKKILIHSWNPEGADEMKDILSGIHGVNVTVRQFGR